MTDKPTTPPAGEPTNCRQCGAVLRFSPCCGRAEALSSKLEQEKDAFDGQAKLTAEAQSKLAEAQSELEAERGKEAPVDVFYKRMAESGHSYDAKAGIWWSDDSWPGVLVDLEAKLAEMKLDRDAALGALGYSVSAETPDGRYQCGLCGPRQRRAETAEAKLAATEAERDDWKYLATQNEPTAETLRIQRDAALSRVARCHRLLVKLRWL